MKTQAIITRTDYLNKNATHREYYGQFVTESVKRSVLSEFSKEELLASADGSFNDIKGRRRHESGLDRWDRAAKGFTQYLRHALKEAGDFYSLAGGVCVAKEAATQIVESL